MLEVMPVAHVCCCPLKQQERKPVQQLWARHSLRCLQTCVCVRTRACAREAVFRRKISPSTTSRSLSTCSEDVRCWALASQTVSNHAASSRSTFKGRLLSCCCNPDSQIASRVDEDNQNTNDKKIGSRVTRFSTQS